MDAPLGHTSFSWNVPSEADAAHGRFFGLTRILVRGHRRTWKATPTSNKREISVDNEVVALARKHLYAHTITQEQFDIVKGRHGKSHIEKTWSRKDMDSALESWVRFFRLSRTTA